MKVVKQLHNYKLFFHEKFDNLGKKTKTYYTIYEEKQFLFFKYWTPITERKRIYADYWIEDMRFDTEEDAQNFIQEQLCIDKPRDETVVTEVKTFSCKGGGMMI